MSGSSAEREFEYIVVGGGSAGCVIAGRLAREAGARVLVLEGGPAAEENPETLDADGYKHAFVNDALMIDRFSVPQEGCGGRRIWLGSGRGMGGSGSVNGMVYTRGCVEDFAQWPRGWQWDDVEPGFRDLESMLRPRRREPTRFSSTFVAAATAAGFRESEDLNDGNLSGVFGHEWMNYEGDARRSSYVSYLRNRGAAGSPEIVTGARVRRVLIEGGRAIGVEYDRGGVRHTVRAADEVILCAGALETPRLLMLSGIGPADQLRRVGLPVLVDLPEVGENLHDHPNVTLFFLGKQPVETYYPQLYGFERANPELSLAPGHPDTCYVMYPAISSFRQAAERMLPTMLMPSALYERDWLRGGLRRSISASLGTAPLRALIERLFGIVVILGKPTSRGRLWLRSPRPEVPPAIDPAYFRDECDRVTMTRGVELARSIAGSAPLTEWGSRELVPGRWRSQRAVWNWVEKNAMTTFHYAGTCRMGDDGDAPVDANLSLRGVAGLRVADASVIPVAPVSALNAPSMLIGWRAASAIMRARELGGAATARSSAGG